MSDPRPTKADIDEAIRQLREEAGGHEPYALAVWPRAVEVMKARLAKERNRFVVGEQESMP